MLASVLFILLLSYLAGSIPASVWVSKLFYKKDVRSEGSKNAGLTNTYRLFGVKATIPVAIIDFGKGALAAWLGYSANQDYMPAINFGLCAGLMSIFGHSFTCFAGFKGGKGVLAGLGVYMILTPISAILAFVVWLVVVIPSGYVSLASISAAAAISLFMLFEYFFNEATMAMLLLTIILSIFIIVRHRSNISRLLAGTENRFGKKKPKG
ncbi:MAG: glycerol-3-phosphate 1-O-acyltransferase PlsY [Fibrobacteria bacterium]|nr:glycerol-3-phosphate 1-O-acyltransferase PlsY [Fibrobacteria bacterium]